MAIRLTSESWRFSLRIDLIGRDGPQRFDVIIHEERVDGAAVKFAQAGVELVGIVFYGSENAERIACLGGICEEDSVGRALEIDAFEIAVGQGFNGKMAVDGVAVVPLCIAAAPIWSIIVFGASVDGISPPPLVQWGRWSVQAGKRGVDMVPRDLSALLQLNEGEWKGFLVVRRIERNEMTPGPKIGSAPDAVGAFRDLSQNGDGHDCEDGKDHDG